MSLAGLLIISGSCFFIYPQKPCTILLSWHSLTFNILRLKSSVFYVAARYRRMRAMQICHTQPTLKIRINIVSPHFFYVSTDFSFFLE